MSFHELMPDAKAGDVKTERFPKEPIPDVSGRGQEVYGYAP
jgi:hypothetical protein